MNAWVNERGEAVEMPLKTWLVEAAAVVGCAPATIFGYKQRGLFTRTKFRRVNARVITVSGSFRPAFRPGKGVRQRYRFARVDWSLPNCEIARALGCSPSLVSMRRRKGWRV